MLRLLGLSLLYSCLSGTWCIAAPVAVEDSSLTEEAFRSKAPGDWERYARFARKLQGTVKFRIMVPADSKGRMESITSTMEILQNASCGSFRHVSEGGKPRDSKVFLTNSSYTAQLTRKPQQAAWLVKSLARPNEPNPTYGQPFDRIKGWTSVHFIAHDNELRNYIQKSGFRVTSFQRTDREGVTLARIEFERHHPYDEKPYDMVQSGILLLDPKSCWCIVEEELQLTEANGDKGMFLAKNEFVRNADGFPIPKRATTRRKYVSRNLPDAETVADFDLRVADPLPSDAEFTLSPYGLPEPPLQRTFMKWFLYINAIGLGLLILGIALRRTARRRMTTSPSV